jgi:hypothetical protein
MKTIGRILLIGIAILVVVVVMVFYETIFHPQRSAKVVQWLRNPEEHAEWEVQANTQCNDAPFMFPTNGLIGYLWGDSFRIGNHHQGIDIFGGTKAGITPVYAAYDGYLTRLSDWKSSLIIRIPDDPLQPGRQIWTYYTHMANANGESYIVTDFPQGTNEVFVKAGTLLGYQGNYSGTPNNPVGVHLHFSIVLTSADGKFENELEIKNTLDPSSYFGLPLNGKENKDTVPVCTNNS